MSEGSSTPSRAGTPVASLPDIPNSRPYRFAWDQSSRRGPESVSGTTEGRGDYITARPRIDFLNASTASLALRAVPSEWSSSKHGFHAISTVLNNPHKRQAPPKAHSTLPAVPPADLPRVRRKDFDGYLRAIGPEWTQFERNMREDPSESDQTPTRVSMDPSSMVASSSSRQARTLPPLETVPQVFFAPDFNLGNPRVYREVTEQGVTGDDGLDPSSLSYSLPLLEKLSHYADTVEQHLVQEISIRSSSFFAALTNLNELQTESEECLDRISKLRGLLRDIDEKGSKKGLEIVRKEAQLSNIDTVKTGVKFISGVMEMSTVAKGLVSAGQWSEALDVIEEIDSLWEARPAANGATSFQDDVAPRKPRQSTLHSITEGTDIAQATKRGPKHSNLPLSTLQAFSSLPDHLRVLSLDIASSLSSEVVETLRTDLLDRVSWISEHPDATNPVWKPQNQLLGDRLRPLLNNLVRTKGVRNALVAWRDVVLNEVKAIALRHIPGFTVDDLALKHDSNNLPDSRPGLGNHLRSMGQIEFLSLLRSIYRSFLTCVEGLQHQSHIFTEILGSIIPTSSNILQSLEEELADILSTSTELTNTVAASIISLRSDLHASLDLPEFLELFNESWDFVVKCEVICRRMIVGLRGVVVGQAKTFLQTYHQYRLSRSAKLVEDEQWNPAEILPTVQHMTNIIIDSAVHDSAELVLSPDRSSPLEPINGGRPPPVEARSPIPPAAKPGSHASKHLRIEERSYYAVFATTETLALLLDYIRLVVNFSVLTTDTMSRVIEFMKAFNSRTCQVVLGAGAMRSAGLKNITAKHLALASQSLSIMIVLIPYVREAFRRHLSSKQAIMLVEFDKLKRDYQEHQNEIHDKLVAIMGDRLSVHIKSLQEVDWNVPKPGGSVNDYMEILIKETVTLHKVLTRYLPTPTVEYVMSQVLAAINHRLSEEYGKIELPHQEAKTRLLADAKFLHQKLSALKNITAVSNMLETVVSEKSTPRPNLPSTPTSGSPLPSSGLSANSRFKGLLSGKSMPPTPTIDKALPTPTPAPMLSMASTPTSVPLPTSPPVPKRASTLNGRLEQLMGGLVNHQDSEKAIPALPLEDHPTSNGFKQIESPALPEKQPRILYNDLADNNVFSRSMSTTLASDEPGNLDTTRDVAPHSEAPPSTQNTDVINEVAINEPAPPLLPDNTGSTSPSPS